MQNDRLLLAYTGAIIDGEGCICLSKKTSNFRNRFQLQIKVANTSKSLIDFLFQNFNGGIQIGKPKSNHQQFWVWALTGNSNLIIFLEKIIPFLLIKREQAKLALEFARNRINVLNKPNTEREYLQRDIIIYKELRRLKKEYTLELPSYNFSEEEKLYYSAGLVDGEGSVRITKSLYTNKYNNTKLILVPQISVANTDKRITDFLLNEFGGFIVTKQRFNKERTIYQWMMQGNNKIDFYLKLKDKLLIKNERLDLLLKYLDSRKNNYKRTRQEIEIFLKLREYNKKGKDKYFIDELQKYTNIIKHPRKLLVEKEKLEDLYTNQKLSIRQIAKIYNVAFDTVRLRLLKYGVRLRDFKEGIKLHPSKFTEEGKERMRQAISESQLEKWQSPLYREKMLKVLEFARNEKRIMEEMNDFSKNIF